MPRGLSVIRLLKASALRIARRGPQALIIPLEHTIDLLI